MNTQYLREFLVLRETLSFSAAADRLFITQSSLSKHIRTLEEELGSPLFYRNKRHVQLTQYGELIVPTAHAIINAEDSMARSLAFIQSNKLLSIGISPSMTKDALYRDLIGTNFSLADGKVALRIIVDDTNNLMNSLRAGTCDYAFLRSHSDTPWLEGEFHTTYYKTETMNVILKSDHPLAGREHIDMKELRYENFLLLQPGTFSTRLCEAECSKAGFVPRSVYYSHSGTFIRQLIAEGKGVFFTSSAKEDDVDNPNIVHIPISPPIEIQVLLCFNKDRIMMEKDRIFLDFIGKYFQ